MTTLTIALDKSARRVDDDGRLHVERSHISKAAVNPYYGSEIPGYESLGLNPGDIYYLFRDPIELEKAASTFARLPILSKHIPVTVDEPRGDLIIGAIGSDVAFSTPYLDADLCFWDAFAIAGIETGEIKELSSAYRYVPVMEPGEFEGKAYDGRMTNIRGNHLALVEIGRAGSDVVVSDQNPFTFKEKVMRMSKLGKALFAALSAVSPRLAADAALPALVGSVNHKNFKKEEIKAKLIALDSELDQIKLGDLIDTLLDMEPQATSISDDVNAVAAKDDGEMDEVDSMGSDDSVESQLRSILAGKVDDSVLSKIIEMCSSSGVAANDDDGKIDPQDQGMKKEEVKAAMDSLRNSLREQFREAAQARDDVRNVVGDVHAMDSADEIYGFALDHMKVDRKGVKGTAALRAIFKVASTKSVSTSPRLAQDAGVALEKQYPNLKRFRIV